ncbi:MAG: carboxypeptidase regulatory-like domain-containing protein [Candidatus Doudnabacteria bacterium]|nr:carboxypeptidase regulatory-like domain-containing protein [Candidatus Doudnabacteria bacterium]
MKEKLQKAFVALFIVGAIFWMLLVITTSFIPKDQNPLMPLFMAVLGVDEDFQAKPKIVTEVKTFDDLLYSQTWYNFYAVGSFIVITGLFTLTKGRNLVEKYMMLQAYALPRQRDHWGTVVDRKTRVPVAFASIRILKQDTGNATYVAQSVADLDGKYRLYLASRDGEYILEVTAPSYKPYRQKLESTFVDGTKAVRVNIFLEKELDDLKVSTLRQVLVNNQPLLLKFLTALIFSLSLTTFLHAVYSIIMHFGFVSVGNMIFYGFALPWNIFVIWERRKFNPGKVLNTLDNKPIAGVSLQIFLPNGNMLSLLSDKEGIVKLDVEPGEYQMRVTKAGFLLDGKPDATLTVSVNRDGYLRKNVYMKPTGEQLADSSSALANPFGD